MSCLFYFFRHYTRGIGVKLAFLLVQHAGSIVSVMLFGHLVAQLGGGTITALQAGGCVALIAAVDAAALLSQYGYNISLLSATAQAGRRLKEEALERFMRLDTQVRESTHAGEWEQRICGDTQMVASCAYPALWDIIGTLIAFVMVSGVLMGEHPLFILLVLILAGAFYGVYRLNAPHLTATARNAREMNYSEGVTLLDFLALSPIMSHFRVTQRMLSRYSLAAEQVEKSAVAVEKSSQTYTVHIRAVMLLGYIVCLAVSVFLCRQGLSGVGELVANMMLVGQLAGQLGQLVFTIPSLNRGAESASALNTAFGLLGKRATEPSPVESLPNGETPALAPLLSLQDVSFSYRDGNPILNHLSWEVRPHEYHSILGRNGAGKSTLIRLILGSLRETGGCVDRTYRCAGYVPQTTAIFRGSLSDNITLCHDSIEREVVDRVLRVCRLGDLVDRLGGPDAEISSEQLSGGETQRIGIARALAIQPDLLVVDEITNNLDIVNKAIIFETLRELRRTCTIISISHDMEALADSDSCRILHRGTLHPIPDGTAEEKRRYAFNIIQSYNHANGTHRPFPCGKH